MCLYNKETGNRVLRGVKTKVVIIFVALHNKPNFDLSRCYEFLPSKYKGHNHMVFDTLKFEA